MGTTKLYTLGLIICIVATQNQVIAIQDVP